MLKKRESKIGPSFKLNLIPIMDAVFIFIFFLLFSAQFIKIFEHGGDVPVISEAPVVKKEEKDPLNLKMKILSNKIVVTTGLEDKTYKEFDRIGNDFDYKQITNTLISIKNANKDEDYAIIIPQASTKYELIVKIMDLVRFVPEKMIPDVDAVIFPEGRIFKKLVLEPIE